MKKLVLSCVAVALVGLVAAAPAKALVVSSTLTLAPGSQFDFVLTALGASTSGGVSVPLTGTIDATFDNDFDTPVALGLQFDGSDINLGDGGLSLPLGPLGAVFADLIGLGFSATSGPLTPVSSSGSMSTFDLGGTTLSIDQGLITYEATGFAGTLIDPGTFDFNTDPLDFPVDPGPTVKVIEELAEPGKANVTLVIPINVESQITTDTTDIKAILNATIIATGMKLVPEPTTMVLLGIGAIGFLAVVGRQRRRS